MNLSQLPARFASSTVVCFGPPLRWMRPALARPYFACSTKHYLEEFNRYSRHALNSFVHSGIHALHRTRHGYPEDMALTAVRFSNGLSHLGYRLLASLSGSQNRMN